MAKSRLVMPPAVSIPLALLFHYFYAKITEFNKNTWYR
jgi:hypothetical protein